MENILLEQTEVEIHEPRRRERPATLHIQTTAHPGSKNQFKTSKAKRTAAAIDAATVSSVSGKTTNGPECLRGRNELQLPETVVAVFPPSDIESLTSAGRRAGVTHPYYTNDSAISTVKCMMSTVLFLAVVAAIIVVAIVKNPGM